MKRWHKALIAGSIAGVAGYGIDALVSRDGKMKYAVALIPAIILGGSTGTIAYLMAKAASDEGFPEDLGAWPQRLPQWPYAEGVNLPRVKMADGTAGPMFTR